jgi:ComF family protein
VGHPKTLRLAAAAADAALALLLAPACAACRAPLETPTRGPVCAACWSRIVPFTPPRCERCGEPLATWRPDPPSGNRCPECRGARTSLSRIRTVGGYEGVLRDIIHALKYDRRRAIAATLAALMRAHGSEVLAGADVCVPVPLHFTRRWARGFNQSEALAAGLGLPVARVLRRVRRTAAQADLPADRRQANVRSAFAMRRGAGVRGLVVLLVDDVMTTGATLEACARVLKEAGAGEVRALTAAKAVRRRP